MQVAERDIADDGDHRSKCNEEATFVGQDGRMHAAPLRASSLLCTVNAIKQMIGLLYKLLKLTICYGHVRYGFKTVQGLQYDYDFPSPLQM